MLYEGVAWTTLSVLDWTTQRFTEAGITAARLEAQILLAHVLGCTRMQIYTGFDIGTGKPGPITLQLQRKYLDLVAGQAPDPHNWLTYVRAERAAKQPA